jgi:two-component system sensor histidine kinase KdpD
LAAASTAQRPGLEDKRAELASMIERQTRRLAGMVEDLLTAAKLEREISVPELERVDLAELVRVATSDAAVAGRQVGVEAPDHVYALADADGLRRVVDNLIDNAHKYGEPPVRIVLEQREERVCLSVLDAGPGIKPEDRERIFERFQRLDGTERAPGLGLGLSIVRGLVDACGGEVVIEDAPGGGAAIRILLTDEVRTKEAV